ncbi:MAG TPA: hypothetical protein VGN08_06695 [Solirubrobacteraceae bacterium]
MDLDRQAIERRDFPIGRRGYDTAAVDAHLQALALEFEDLQRAAGGAGEGSLASAAGSQVQSIVEAAERAAREIERQAMDGARAVREEAQRDAERTRNDAIEKARVHVAAVSQVAGKLLQRVGSMDGEVGALMETLRAGAGRLTGDLAAIESGMAELYDAAAGRPPAATVQGAESSNGEVAAETAPNAAPAPPAPEAKDPAPGPASATQAPAPDAQPPASIEAGAAGATRNDQAAGSGDVDGARLIALNMALNGEPREATERYLAENFQLADRLGLVDEVYAAIEG